MRWLPRLRKMYLTQTQTSKEYLELINFSQDFPRFKTVNETLIHIKPDTNQQSKQWVSLQQSVQKKNKLCLPDNEVMTTIFWNADSVIHIDCLQKGQTINGKYHANVLNRHYNDLRKMLTYLIKKTVLFHQDNAKMYKCLVDMAEFGFGPNDEIIARPNA